MISFHIISDHIVSIAYTQIWIGIINNSQYIIILYIYIYIFTQQQVMPILFAIFIQWSLQAEAAGGKQSTAFGAGSFAGVPGPPKNSCLLGGQKWSNYSCIHTIVHVWEKKNSELGSICFVRWRRSLWIIIALTSFDYPVQEWFSPKV